MQDQNKQLWEVLRYQNLQNTCKYFWNLTRLRLDRYKLTYFMYYTFFLICFLQLIQDHMIKGCGPYNLATWLKHEGHFHFKVKYICTAGIAISCICRIHVHQKESFYWPIYTKWSYFWGSLINSLLIWLLMIESSVFEKVLHSICLSRLSKAYFGKWIVPSANQRLSQAYFGG